ncbi:response regulator [Shinella yambaruensis]|uniref:Response regulator n=1 Tax=Shinella yambaruensis TaxID=415996 RepID=A0ABQ5ZDT2_9HYPH|nr:MULTISPECIES: response regulator [Shinella]CAI0336710.1 Response regulatory domain-containing protein [Rhizobiaceae bacterium]CAK7255242.1 Response regulatory domain-containing protein [Shinella sp. WSC3-e]MCJ8029736.1 response regulator [Shinella yambaruensis]MCO5141430.1 response regulator [Shinella sp.]MCU7982706.1 response regulator [Shinella yambaruensis]
MTIQSILVVDDDENDQFICEYTIRKYDPSIRIIKAFDGSEALDILHRETPDAIILDINMPVMNGFEFLDRYAEEFEVHAPVVAMLTSSHLGKDRERAMQYSFVKSYFEKPLQSDHLRLMTELLDE